MGEMASSVAHELNQPLTAITNYCNGMVSRVNNDAIDKADLVAALQKTARQAERAGQIIHRIRAFVKRSEPVRQLARAQDIVDDAVDLAGHRAAASQCRHPHLCRAAPAAADGRPDPDRAGGAQPAEERRRGDRQRPACRRRAAASSCGSCRCTPRRTAMPSSSPSPTWGPG
jgi:signal transduction histidine kinase